MERADLSGTGNTSAMEEAHAKRTDVSAVLPNNLMAVQTREAFTLGNQGKQTRAETQRALASASLRAKPQKSSILM